MRREVVFEIFPKTHFMDGSLKQKDGRFRDTSNGSETCCCCFLFFVFFIFLFLTYDSHRQKPETRGKKGGRWDMGIW